MTNEPSRKRSRTTHARAVLGGELHANLAEVKVLVVGAGGIGCELCKSYLRNIMHPILLIEYFIS